MTIEFNAKEIDEPYELYFFLGPVPASVADWRVSPLRLFEPITSHAPGTTSEFRDLNGYLENHYGDKLKDDDVIPKLRKDLSWGVKQVKSYHAITSRISFQRSSISTRRLKTRC